MRLATKTIGLLSTLALFGTLGSGCGEVEDRIFQDPSKQCDSGLYSEKTMSCVDTMTNTTSTSSTSTSGTSTTDTNTTTTNTTATNTSSTGTSTSTATATSTATGTNNPQVCSSNSGCGVDGEECLDDPSGAGVCGTPASCKDVLDTEESDYCDRQAAGTECLPSLADDTMFVCRTPSVVAKEAKYIRIIDVATPSCGGSTVGGLSDAGSDIASVTLLDDQGDEIGAAKFPSSASAYSPGAGNPEYNDASTVFDGTIKPQNSRSCPEQVNGLGFRTDSVVSLGCGGSIILQFVDAADVDVSLASGNQISVVEYGTYCDPSKDATAFGTDRYTIELCLTDANAAFDTIDFDASCTSISGPTEAGPTVVDVTL